MAIQRLLTVLATFLALVHAQEQADHMTVYRDEGCDSNAADYLKYDLNFPSEGGGKSCTQGSAQLKGWETDDTGSYTAWFDGRGIGAGCKMAILNEANVGSQFCGDALVVIDGDVNVGACRKLSLPVNHGVARCCGDQDCFPVIPNRRDVVDVTQVKRSPVFAPKKVAKRAECKWEGGATYKSRAAPQTIPGEVACPKGEMSCRIKDSKAVTKGSSNTFGVSEAITAGVLLPAVALSTTTFSYTYTKTESTTETLEYDIVVPPGQTGYLTFTPYTECAMGTFTGDCDGADTDKEGQVCIPDNEGPGGEFRFLQIA